MRTVETVVPVITGMMLLLSGIQDVRRKKISLWIILAGSVMVSICIPFCSNISIWDKAGGIAVGMLMIVISLLTGGKIGMGDGLLLCVTGLAIGFWSNLELLAAALFLAAVVSIVLLVLRLADRKKSIPFVPFLFLGYVMLFAINVNAGT